MRSRDPTACIRHVVARLMPLEWDMTTYATELAEHLMTRILALIPVLALATAITARAQEATPPDPTHEKFTIATEPKPVTFVADLVGRFLGDGSGEDQSGFYPSVGRIVSGAGWISIGPGYRQRVFGDRAVIDGSAAISWRAYKMGQARFEFTDLANSRVALGTQLLWQDLTQLNYFGNGPESAIDGRSECSTSGGSP